MRASTRSSSAIASRATSRSSPCATTKRSMTSKSGAARPSRRTTTPSSTSSSGSGSSGPSAATRPSSGCGDTSSSRLSSRRSRASKRRLRTCEQPSLLVHGRGLPHERRRAHCRVPVEAGSPALQLRRGRPARAERRVDLEQLAVRYQRQLGRPLQALGERLPSRGARDRRLPAQRLRGGPRIAAEIRPARTASSVTSASGVPPSVDTRSGRRLPSG